LEKADVAYGPHPEPGTEASTEATKKKKADAFVRPVRKRIKVTGKKKVDVVSKYATTPKADAAPKVASAAKAIATSKASAAPMIVAAFKASTASKVATMKAATLVAPKGAADAATLKTAVAGHKGAPGAVKASTLRINAGVKKPTNSELSLVEATKTSKKLSLALSSIPTST
jgi:hypothetical protein